MDDSAPLSRWETSSVFKTRAECQARQSQPPIGSEADAAETQAKSTLDNDQKLRPEAATLLPDDFVEHFVRTRQSAIQLSQCIAADDPRLKGD